MEVHEYVPPCHVIFVWQIIFIQAEFCAPVAPDDDDAKCFIIRSTSLDHSCSKRLKRFYSNPNRGCKVLWWVYLFVYLLAYGRNNMAELTKLLCVSRVDCQEARSSSCGVEIRYVLPVLWMTSRFHIMGSMARHVTCITRQRFHLDLRSLGTLIGSHTLPVNRNHWCAAPMTGSARNRVWYRLTSALDSSTATRLLAAIGRNHCIHFISTKFYSSWVAHQGQSLPSTTALFIFDGKRVSDVFFKSSLRSCRTNADWTHPATTSTAEFGRKHEPLFYVRQVNGVKLADILFSLLCVCLCVRPWALIFRCKCLENDLR